MGKEITSLESPPTLPGVRADIKVAGILGYYSSRKSTVPRGSQRMQFCCGGTTALVAGAKKLASNGDGKIASSFRGGNGLCSRIPIALLQWLGIFTRPRKSPAGSANHVARMPPGKTPRFCATLHYPHSPNNGFFLPTNASTSEDKARSPPICHSTPFVASPLFLSTTVLVRVGEYAKSSWQT